MELSFFGATGTVTGSRYLLRTPSRTVLIDCGLFQGLKQLRLRNRQPFPVAPERIDAVVVTHAHIDHTGYLPALVRDGFRGRIYCTEATRDLCEILLPDSARIQEEEAERANRKGYTRHAPAAPLYTVEDAERALSRFTPVAFDEAVDLGGGMSACWSPAGHILGAAMVRISDGERTILFSGDLGRSGDPLLPDPAPAGRADFLVVESTYGDRLHEAADAQATLAEVINRTIRRGGSVVIPSFAVGRTQLVLYHLNVLRARNEIPTVPVYLDSPMAVDATRIFQQNADIHRLTPAQALAVCSTAELINSVEDSKRIGRSKDPRIIISASGMATGGRVLHHLARLAPDARNTILFAGYQAAGTRGAKALAGAPSLKIHGRHVSLRAEVAQLGNLSAHADRDGILAWLRTFEDPPRQTFITHGEPEAADALRLAIEEELGWRCRVPEHLEQVTLVPEAVAAGE